MDGRNINGLSPLADRFAGCCLGLAVGDALGAPVEGWPRQRIAERHGWLEEMVPGRLPSGSYTDDGQMALGLLESLVWERGFNPAACAARWAALYDPARGYGGRIHGIMAALAQGKSWHTVGTDSWGNGAAMRIGPLGGWYFRDPERLIRAALESASITHRHARALAGAVVQALAVGRALSLGLEGKSLEPGGFLPPLIRAAKEIDPETARRLKPLLDPPPWGREALRARLTSLFACDVRAIEAVGPALGAVLGTGSFQEAVVLAVNLGGDTDTLGAMAGAVAGAYYGLAAIPGPWLEALENGPGQGRDYLLGLAVKAAELIGAG